MPAYLSCHASMRQTGRASLALTVLAIALSLACSSASPTEPTPPQPPTPPAGPNAVAPSITTQPGSAIVDPGQSAALTVAASGTGPISYQWFLGQSGDASAPIGNATAAAYTTPSLSASSAYWVRVSNSAGAANSETAMVTVRVAAPAPPSPGEVFEEQVLAIVNQVRAAGATCGTTVFPAAGALTMNASLRIAARLHSEDMGANGYFSHTSLDGRTFDQRIHNVGYFGSPLGENIAAGYATPQSVMDGWMASPGHCSNIMAGSYRSIGVGYAYRAGSPYGHYWTQDFGG